MSDTPLDVNFMFMAALHVFKLDPGVLLHSIINGIIDRIYEGTCQFCSRIAPVDPVNIFL